MFAAAVANNGVPYVFPPRITTPVRFWPWRRFALYECSLVDIIVINTAIFVVVIGFSGVLIHSVSARVTCLHIFLFH